MNEAQKVPAPSTPQVAVVIPCHDSTRTIGLQLQALAAQEKAPDFEVVLVDNLSSDDLGAAVKGWRTSLDLRVVVANAMPNPGYARNVGVAHTHAQVLAFCDSDDYVSKSWVREAAEVARVASVANGAVVAVDEASFALGSGFLDQLLDDMISESGDVPRGPVPYPVLLGGSCVIRRDVYLAVGGYDVSVPYGVEDNDLALRLQEAGHLIGRAPGMKLAYRLRSDSDETLARALRGGFRHQLLAHRHGLFGRSPSLPLRWYLGLLRCAVAALRMVLRPDTRDWRSLGRRAALQAGLVAGHVRYGLLGSPPAPRPGVGLGSQRPDHDSATTMRRRSR